MTDEYDELRRLTADAVRQAQAELARQFGADRLHGFALCTDDDVSTLFHTACTRSWVEEREPKYEGIGCIYVEWEQTASDTLFESASELVAGLANAEQADEEAWAAARDRRFAALVRGLQDCRDAGLFDADALLCCGSTDPSEHLEALAMQAVDRLNQPAAADQFAEHLGYEHHRTTG